MNQLGKYISELEQVLNSLPADMVYYINYGLNKINLDDVNLGIKLNLKQLPRNTSQEVLKEYERTLESSLIDFIREGLVNKMRTEFSRFYMPTDGGTFIDIYAPMEQAFQRTPTNKKIELLDAKIEFGAEVNENFDLKTYFESALHEFCVQKLLPDINAISNPGLNFDEQISYEKEFESNFDNNLKNNLVPGLLSKTDLDSYVRYKTEDEIENLVNSINALKEEKTQIYSNPSKISEAYGESSAQLDEFKECR